MTWIKRYWEPREKMSKESNQKDETYNIDI
jgi:hypothetical protein